MASHSGGFQPLCGNEEMASEIGKPRELSEFLKTAELPICVCVTSGKHLSKSVQITKGDILFLKSCEAKTLILTHQESSTGSRKQVNVPINFPYKFSVLPPKNVSDKTASLFMYPSVADLILDSPTYFEATTPYDDPYLPGFSIHRGDKFKFRGLVTDPKDGRERLKVFDELDNVIFLSLDCRANFFPLEDEESYTLRQLIDFAPVPRRLRISKRDSVTSGDSGFKDSGCVNEDEKQNSLDRKSESSYDQSVSELINYTGVIHMLKPSLSVIASPLNDVDTIWKIPVTANLCVREHDLDDYEVPSVVKSAANNQSSSSAAMSPSSIPQTPTFPAPPTPPLPQPLVPVDIFNFIDIYGCPVKAKIMDMLMCDGILQNLLSASEELLIYQLLKTKRLYAEDVKTAKVYSLAEDLQLSFIEYPEKFSVMSELLKLPVGSEVTVLEDIASDFPRPFFLQFGDILRITTNQSSVMKAKHTTIECKVLKCEKVNREGGSNQKMKLPLDFDVKMIISTDPNNRRVIGLNEIINGKEPIPSQEVATLIDSSEKMLEDLPVNMKLLKVLPERLLVASPFCKKETVSPKSGSEAKQMDWPSPIKHSASDKNIGISLSSRLVLAFRERLDAYEVDLMKAQAGVTHVPFEILTPGQFEERERMCKVWADEEESEVQSLASDEQSIPDTPSQGNASTTGKSEKRRKKMDKIRRLSQVLNPKHWRPSKSAPEPLPHPSAMGLMALSMRPPSDQHNDYQIKGQEEETQQPSVSSDEETNVYEDVEIGPLRTGTGSPLPVKNEPKTFSGPLHKSMPSRTNAKNRTNKRRKTPPPQSAPPSIEKSSTFSVGENELIDEASGDPFYDQPEDLDQKQDPQPGNHRLGQGYETPRNNLLKRVPTDAMAPRQNTSLPPLPPRRSSSSISKESNGSSTVSKQTSLDSLNQSKSSISTSNTSDKEEERQEKEKISLDPPVPPRRRNRANRMSSQNDTKNVSTSSITAVCSRPSPKKESSSASTNSVTEDNHKNDKAIEDKTSSLNPSLELKSQSEKITKVNKDKQTEKVNPQKPPVPKPRGLKKPRNADSLSRTDSSSSSTKSEIVEKEHKEKLTVKEDDKERERDSKETLKGKEKFEERGKEPRENLDKKEKDEGRGEEQKENFGQKGDKGREKENLVGKGKEQKENLVGEGKEQKENLVGKGKEQKENLVGKVEEGRGKEQKETLPGKVNEEEKEKEMGDKTSHITSAAKKTEGEKPSSSVTVTSMRRIELTKPKPPPKPKPRVQ